MGGVDLADQKIKYYSSTRKTKKWVVKLFFWLNDLRLLVLFVLFVKNTDSKMKFIDHKRLALAMFVKIGKGGVSNSKKIPNSQVIYLGSCVFIDNCTHQLVKTNSRIYCAQCSSEKVVVDGVKRKRIGTKCSECDKFLCSKTCFFVWHNLKKGD